MANNEPLSVLKSLFIVFGSLVLAATTVRARPAEIPWPGHGKITLDVPINWSLHRNSQGEAVCTLRADRAGTPAAVLQLSVVALPPGKSAPTKDELKGQLEKNTAPELPGSIEKVFLPRMLRLAEGFGWYVQLTDASLVNKPAKTEDLKIMRSGLALLEDHTVAVVTMQFDDPDGDAPREMEDMVESLRVQPAPADALQIRRVDDYFELTVAQFRLQLKIPAPDFSPENANIGGATANPRFFYFKNSRSGVSFSGWFESASRYSDLPSYWKSKADGFKRSGLPEPTHVRYGKIGDWETIEYDTTLPGVTMNNSHLLAELAQAGTWIDLHASITSERPTENLHAELRAVIESLVVEKK